MKVLLRTDVEGIGRKGDICDVAAGYARNYLMPRGLALRASRGAQRQAEAMQRAAMKARAESQLEAEAIAQRLAPTEINVIAKATDTGNLYGSVTPALIVDAIAEQLGVTVDPKSVIIKNPIRELGIYTVNFQLHEEVNVPATISVTAE